MDSFVGRSIVTFRELEPVRVTDMAYQASEGPKEPAAPQAFTPLKRDLDLIRSMLLEIEAGTLLCQQKQYDEEIWNYHIWLLNQAKLVEGISAQWCVAGNACVWTTSRPILTWEGCEFLSAARNEGYWRSRLNEIRTKAGQALIELPFEVVKSILIDGLVSSTKS